MGEFELDVRGWGGFSQKRPKLIIAAVLAIKCAELRDAKRLIGRALAGNPLDHIANELRDLLLEEIYSQRQAIEH